MDMLTAEDEAKLDAVSKKLTTDILTTVQLLLEPYVPHEPSRSILAATIVYAISHHLYRAYQQIRDEPEPTK